MKIAVIGGGNVGKALAGSFTQAGHDVTISASSPESAEEKASHVGVRPAPTNRDAVASADVIVLAVWFSQGEEVAREIAEVARGKVVIDVTNPLKPTYDGLVTEGGPSAAEHFAEWIPGARVAKAFNTAFASVQSNPSLHGVAADGFFATDDEEARRIVHELVESIGFRAVDVGQLSMARYLEALHFINVALNAANGWSWNTAYKLLGAPIPEPHGAGGSARAEVETMSGRQV
ncbi:MAG: NADPH-dependent F420 reductase [Chloroflexota bacterium]|nr:NADPH-dependent F420 reductase [Chloroflexota bacterium]